MVGRYKAYPAYKDSGVEWVKKVPSNWLVKPTYSVFEPTSQKNTDGAENTVLSLSYGHIVERDVEQNFGLLPASFNTYQIVSVNELILRLTDLQNDKKSLRVAISYLKGIITSAYLKLKVKKDLLPKYSYYLLHSYDTKKVFYGMGGGLRQSMTFEEFRRLPILVPNLSEQQTIAQFLDYETAKIDALIAKQEQLIELLKEKRQAVISHAVTKGLNPDAPMKDSGVEWLGQVPEHWEVIKLKNIISNLESGCSVNAEDTPVKENEVGVLKTSCVYTRKFRASENKRVFVEDLERVKCPARKGAIIISRMNTPDLVGASALVDIEIDNIYLPDRLWQTKFSKEVSSEFLVNFMLVEGFRNQISLSAEGASSSMQSISKESYLNIHSLLPPLHEQIEISSFIYSQENRLDKLVSNSEVAISLLQERKTALISAAVTGKIDVRDWQPPSVG